MADSVIAAERAKYGQTRVVSPYLLQLDSEVNIPDYWEDERYDPNYTWAAANNPRYANEESWAESAPDGYKEQNIMSADAIAATKA